MDTRRDFAEEPAEAPAASPEAVEATSSQYLGRWNLLVSTTNWEKGQIIHQWRETLIAAGADAASYSDEAWSRRVGNVTPQHVGRLRRVFQRFSSARGQFTGLYWSHFQAALDWDDAEMWLEGALHDGWSIAQMQQRRAEVLGTVAEEAAAAEVQTDEDAAPFDTGSVDAVNATLGEVRADDDEADDLDDDDSDDSDSDASSRDSAEAFGDQAVEPVRPFAAMPALPADMADAVESLKLAIVHHRTAGWQEVSPDEVLDALAALRQFVLAPAE